MGGKQPANVPSVAVAICDHLFVYRALQPEMKFRVPPASLPRNERPLWMMLKQDLASISKEFPGIDTQYAVEHAALLANRALGRTTPVMSTRTAAGSPASGTEVPKIDETTLNNAAAKVSQVMRTFVLKLKHMRDNLASPTPLSPLAKELLGMFLGGGNPAPTSPTSPSSPSSTTSSPPIPEQVVPSDGIAADGLPVLSGSQIIYAYRITEGPLEVPTCATCLATVPRSTGSGTSSQVSHIIIGTENSKVHVLNAQATEVMFTLDLPSPPTAIQTLGYIDVDYQFYISCRDNNIYCAKKDRPLSLVVSAEGQLVEFALGDRMIYVGTSDDCIRAYTTHGKLDIRVPTPEPIVGLSVLRLPRQPGTEALLVALRSGRVRLMCGRETIAELNNPLEEQEIQQRQLLGNNDPDAPPVKIDDPVTAMRFSPYGREEAALLLAYRSGAVTVKFLHRKFTIPSNSSLNTVPPPEQDVPLDMPVLTSLFLQQAERLREQSIDIHHRFEKDLCKLRLLTAKTYLNILTGAEGPVSSNLAASLRVSANVQGLGPKFKLRIDISNMSPKPLHGLVLSIAHDPAVTRVSPPSIKLPALFTGIEYPFSFTVTTIASVNSVVSSVSTEFRKATAIKAAAAADDDESSQQQSSVPQFMAVGVATNVSVQIIAPASTVPLISSSVPIPAPQVPMATQE